MCVREWLRLTSPWILLIAGHPESHLGTQVLAVLLRLRSPDSFPGGDLNLTVSSKSPSADDSSWYLLRPPEPYHPICEIYEWRRQLSFWTVSQFSGQHWQADHDTDFFMPQISQFFHEKLEPKSPGSDEVYQWKPPSQISISQENSRPSLFTEMLCNCWSPLENCPGGCSMTHHRECRSMPLGLHWRNRISWNSGGALTWTSCPRVPNGSKSPKSEPWYTGAPVMGNTRGMGCTVKYYQCLGPRGSTPDGWSIAVGTLQRMQPGHQHF